MDEELIQKFRDKGVKVRFINGEPVFNPYDVGKILGMTKNEIKKAIEEMDDEYKVLLPNKEESL